MIVLPQEDFLSGLSLSVGGLYDRPPLHVRVFRMAPDGLQKEREVRIERNSYDEESPVFVYWRPISNSSGASFKVTVQRLDVQNRAVEYDLADSEILPKLIYSNPRSWLHVPQSIGFSPVTQCNLNCTHCISKFSRKSLSVLDDAIWEQIKEHISVGHITHFCSDYSGDLLNSDRKYGWLKRVVATGVKLNIDTHANNLTEESTEILLASNLTTINFSVDSLLPEQYKTIRKGGDLPTVLRNIRHFVHEKNKRRPEIATMISFAMMRSTMGSLFLAVDLAAEIGINWVQGNHLMVFTEDMADESLLLDRTYYAQKHRELLDYAASKDVTVSLPEPFKELAPTKGHAPCIVPWVGAQILGNGDVMACCMPGTKVGNLHEQSLPEVWNGKRMQAFRSRVNTDTPPGPCASCPMYRVPNNFSSYAPGLFGSAREAFERRAASGLITDPERQAS
ncbi:radical SAM/SPASM domain-containing protein [Rhizobium puerariae]|uniref:Radical SAM/SPASM domain-containing protein n=1 Tax=Rhizobium puerariae TaxID=1585791 RepID=A0ABV6AN23_9HYPH